MFWSKKDDAGPKECPSADDTEGFVDWLLRTSTDFDALRASARANPKRFVKLYAADILADLATHGDEASLTECIHAGCEEYVREYQDMVESVGKLEMLPSHIQNRALPLLVKLRVLMHVLQAKYGATLSAPMLAVTGPLQQA